MASLDRLSFNQITCNQWSLEQAAHACVRHEIPWIALWRDKVAAIGLSNAARIIRETGLRVSSLCRGGYFPGATETDRRANIEDNLRAIDEAATLGTGVLVLVCGPVVNHDLDGSRRMVVDGIGAIESHARRVGIKLGIEPLHPMFAADRSVIVSLKQANLIAAQFSDTVGVVIDVFHVWHDPELYEHIEGARGRIWGFHVNDWPVPIPDVLLARDMMGAGVIEINRIRRAIDAAGYLGPIEVEIFNRRIWDTPGDTVVVEMKRTFEEFV